MNRYGKMLGREFLHPDLSSLADEVFIYTEGNLVYVVPYLSICGLSRITIFHIEEYCIGQKTATGKISEAYKWRERLFYQGISSSLIEKISDSLESM